jgi:hypothetical protein
MGVAGGELLIPTIVLLFAVDIKIAGSLSLMVSLHHHARRPATRDRPQHCCSSRHSLRCL